MIDRRLQALLSPGAYGWRSAPRSNVTRALERNISRTRRENCRVLSSAKSRARIRYSARALRTSIPGGAATTARRAPTASKTARPFRCDWTHLSLRTLTTLMILRAGTAAKSPHAASSETSVAATMSKALEMTSSKRLCCPRVVDIG